MTRTFLFCAVSSLLAMLFLESCNWDYNGRRKLYEQEVNAEFSGKIIDIVQDPESLASSYLVFKDHTKYLAPYSNAIWITVHVNDTIVKKKGNNYYLWNPGWGLPGDTLRFTYSDNNLKIIPAQH